ncbi:hypothetical protein A0O00_03095 [Proteus mirabilis]|nr:hypothetical protein A0O00_03095 [Proteus mirabilis]
MSILKKRQKGKLKKYRAYSGCHQKMNPFRFVIYVSGNIKIFMMTIIEMLGIQYMNVFLPEYSMI